MTERSTSLSPLFDAAADQGPPLPRLAVVVPARNEEHRLPRCLSALESAEAALRAAHPASYPTRFVVVLDRCTDRSQELLADWPGVEVVLSNRGRVGGARAVGVQRALRTGSAGYGSSGAPVPSWIACTDADSAVPVNWLLTQLGAACSDVDLLLGLVQPDAAELAPNLLRSWTLRQHLVDGHPHVHGANLGIRAEMYVRAGGFPDVAVHEDVRLTEQVRRLGGRVVSTATSRVLTSARVSGRTPAGMAGYLAHLTAQDPRSGPVRGLDSAGAREAG